MSNLVRLTPRQRRIAKWPAGWVAEARRLAALYARTARNTTTYDDDRDAAKAVIAHLISLSEDASALAARFESLVNSENQNAMATAFLAREVRLGLGSYESTSRTRMLAFSAEVELVTASLADLATDFALAAETLRERWKSEIGNQSTLAVRFIIPVAASSYVRIFKREPGRSRSDPGTFGHFLHEILALVPELLRPQKMPSPSAIDDGLVEWRRRRSGAK